LIFEIEDIRSRSIAPPYFRIRKSSREPPSEKTAQSVPLLRYKGFVCRRAAHILFGYAVRRFLFWWAARKGQLCNTIGARGRRAFRLLSNTAAIADARTRFTVVEIFA